jgi:hypothetical protein
VSEKYLPPFLSVLLFFQTPPGQENSHQAVLGSPALAWCQSGFQSVSDPRPRRVRRVVGSKLGPLLALHLSGLIAHLATTGEGKFRPDEREDKTERTPILDSPPGPWSN